jgi:hypothetical protein
MAGGATQVADHLPTKCKALSSNSSTARNQTNSKRRPEGQCEVDTRGEPGWGSGRLQDKWQGALQGKMKPG